MNNSHDELVSDLLDRHFWSAVDDTAHTAAAYDQVKEEKKTPMLKDAEKLVSLVQAGARACCLAIQVIDENYGPGPGDSRSKVMLQLAQNVLKDWGIEAPLDDLKEDPAPPTEMLQWPPPSEGEWDVLPDVYMDNYYTVTDPEGTTVEDGELVESYLNRETFTWRLMFKSKTYGRRFWVDRTAAKPGAPIK